MQKLEDSSGPAVLFSGRRDLPQVFFRMKLFLMDNGDSKGSSAGGVAAHIEDRTTPQVAALGAKSSFGSLYLSLDIYLLKRHFYHIAYQLLIANPTCYFLRETHYLLKMPRYLREEIDPRDGVEFVTPAVRPGARCRLHEATCAVSGVPQEEGVLSMNCTCGRGAVQDRVSVFLVP